MQYAAGLHIFLYGLLEGYALQKLLFLDQVKVAWDNDNSQKSVKCHGR